MEAGHVVSLAILPFVTLLTALQPIPWPSSSVVGAHLDQTITTSLPSSVRGLFLHGSSSLHLLLRTAPNNLHGHDSLLGIQLLRPHSCLVLVRIREVDLPSAQRAEMACRCPL